MELWQLDVVGGAVVRRAADVTTGAKMTERAVVVAGGGPTGLMLAAELALAGIDVVIVERRASQDLDGKRAGGLHSRTIEVLDQRGVAERFLSEGQTHPFVGYAGTFLDISDLPTRHNYILAVWQSRFEPILAGWVEESWVPILRGGEVVAFTQDGAGIDVEVSDDTTIRAESSSVRRRAQPDPQGGRHRLSRLGSDQQLPDRRGRHGRGAAGRHAPRGWWHRSRQPGGGRRTNGVVLLERHVEHTTEPTLSELSEALVAADGTDYGVHSPTWISRFTDMTRQAASYRGGTCAVRRRRRTRARPARWAGTQHRCAGCLNLGWKLAQVVKETSPESLLDTYHAERHPVGARVLQNTMAQVALSRIDERSRALRDTRARHAQHGRAADGIAALSPPSTSTTTSGPDIRCSGAACPTSTWSPSTAVARVHLAARGTSRTVEPR